MDSFVCNYQTFMKEMKKRNIQKFIFQSFEEAHKSGFKNSLVVIPDEKELFFDVYVTAIKEGNFGEFASWTSDEFEEELEFDDEYRLLNDVNWFIKTVYSSPNIEKKLKKLIQIYVLFHTIDKQRKPL